MLFAKLVIFLYLISIIFTTNIEAQNNYFNNDFGDIVDSENFNFTEDEESMSMNHPSTPHPVIINKDTLFIYQTYLGSFSPEDRAIVAMHRLNNLSLNRQHIDSIKVVHSGTFSEIFIGESSILTLTDEDASFHSISRDSLVYNIVEKLDFIFDNINEKFQNNDLILTIVYSVFISLIVLLLIVLILKISHKFEIFLVHFQNNNQNKILKIYNFCFNPLKLLSVFIYFYDGFKLVLIVFIIKKASIFMLSLTDIGIYWNYDLTMRGIFNTISISIIALYTLKLTNKISFSLYHLFNNLKPKIMHSIQYKSFSVISEHKLIDLTKILIKFLISFLYLIIIYSYFLVLFSFFQFTETWGSTLIEYIIVPLRYILTSFVDFLPNAFVILVVVVTVKYLLKIIKSFFKAIENQTITLNNFYSDWAQPTYKIVRFLTIIFAVIIIFPYLPGSESPFFKGISVFVGLLFSLGSTSAIANIVGGIVLTYMRPFKIGDLVKISDTTGRIIDKSLLVTRMRTVKNVDITIPNAMVLSTHITNFSSSAIDKGLVVHTIVTQGYDVPWKKVHSLLIKAALSCEHILDEPKPYVLTKKMDDFYIQYEINAYTHNPLKMPWIYSELHQNIQDAFTDEGLELLSPHYQAIRDGNNMTLPTDKLPEGYTKQGFKIDWLTKLMIKND
jgi:small-conductance mechanosensitive channel